MKGDFTRFTFRPGNHYSSVLLQQGRVLLDAEWNEQSDIEAHRDQTTTSDVIGHCGTPMDENGRGGFELHTLGETNVWDGRIGEGRYYTHGILCENEADVHFTNQADLPGVSLPTQPGTYLAYLDVWQRHLTALDRDDLREVALSGPDTATRTKTIWQVRLERVGVADAAITCAQFGDDWQPSNTQSTGQLRAQAAPPQQTTNECLVPPGAGFRRLENQLYRVEIHVPGAPSTATYKWSRDNGSMVSGLRSISGTGASRTVTVDDPGKDSVLGFAGARFVELSDEGRTLRGERGELLEVTSVLGSEITVNIVGTPNLNFGPGATVRRWDGMGTVATGAMTELEDGVQVEFRSGAAFNSFRTGDYWLIPARSLSESHPSGGVLWPRDNAGPIFEPRHGIAHHYCPLGLLQLTVANNTSIWTLRSDCRRLFPPLTELTSFIYLSGDGQEARPGQSLPQLLQVGVMNGRYPVAGASVRFVAEGAGRVAATLPVPPGATSNTIIVATGANGVASCAWRPEANVINPSQQLTATLLDAAGNPTSHPPIRFTANLSLASEVSYTPTNPNLCPDLVGTTTVQEAIDRLCQSSGRDPGIRVTGVFAGAQPLRNDTDVLVIPLTQGIRVVCDQSLFQGSVQDKPVCLVTLDLPFPFNSADRQLWGQDVIGFQPLTLAADVVADGPAIVWRPTPLTQRWLRDSLFRVLIAQGFSDRVLAHLTVKGNFIWAASDPNLYLDGEAFGFRRPGGANTDVRFDGDGRSGGDLEMWFWLVAPTISVGIATLTLSPNPASYGQAVRGTVTLTGPAPADGATVTLTATNPPNDPRLVTVSATAIVAAGQQSANFDVRVRSAVGNEPQAVSTISASHQGVARTITLTILQVIG